MRLAPLFVAFVALIPGSARAQGAPRSDRLPADRWLGADKPAHALGAWTAAGAGYATGLELEQDPAARRRSAVLAALAASLAKEAYDLWIQDERFSFKDLAADAVGAGLFLAFTAAADR